MILNFALKIASMHSFLTLPIFAIEKRFSIFLNFALKISSPSRYPMPSFLTVPTFFVTGKRSSMIFKFALKITGMSSFLINICYLRILLLNYVKITRHRV